MSFLFVTYYFARKIFTVPFMPSKVTWSFSAKEIQENLTLSTKNNVFITFQVSFKSVNRSGNKQFTPSCGSSSLETMTQYFTVWNVHITNLQSLTTVRFLKEEKKTFTKRNLRSMMLFLFLENRFCRFTTLHTRLAKAWAGIKSCVPKILCLPGADPGFFLGGGALVSCSTSTPINHIVFFFGRIPIVFENRRSSQGGGGVRTPCTLPLDPSLSTPMTLSLKRKKSFRTANRIAKLIILSKNGVFVV